jgi:hypothetical protein
MTLATHEALIAATLTLVADHQDLLTHVWQRAAQVRQLAEVAALLRDQDPPLRSATAVVVYGRLVDCLTRLEHAGRADPAFRLRPAARLTGRDRHQHRLRVHRHGDRLLASDDDAVSGALGSGDAAGVAGGVTSGAARLPIT